MTQELIKKICQAVKLIQLAGADGETIEVAYSGGKDSDVILELTRMAGINYRAIYKCTTIDPPGTIKHALDNGAEIVKPKQTFFEICAEAGLPNRWRRMCCKKLKEYKILDKAIIGVRRAESKKRAKRYKEPTECRFYGSKKNHVEAIYPILEWSDNDIADFINERGLKCHPLYYDEKGHFHVERRLGCIGCPLQNKRSKLEQLRKYPGFIRQYVKIMRNYRIKMIGRRTEKGYTMEKIIQSFGGTLDEYEHVCLNLFCKSRHDFEYKFTGLFGRTDCKQFLEEYFNIKFDPSQLKQ